MFSFRDEFTYFECSNGECPHISKIQKNMKRYHPSNYYSFKKGESNNFIK